MGIDIHTHLCEYNPEDNLWYEIELYRKDKEEFKKVRIYDGRNYEMFDVMLNKEEDSFGSFPCIDISLISLEERLRKEIEEEKEYCYGFKEISLSDLRYYLKEYPTVVDYEADEEEWDNYCKKIKDYSSLSISKPQKTNPIQYLYDYCISYGAFAEPWTFGIKPFSQYKLLYWFDH